jgi:hypothetical protein
VTGSTLLRRIVERLDRAGIPHMLTGSFASSAHGHLRATRDIDFVIEADADRLRAFARSLPAEEYYVDEEAALQALHDAGQFNVIDLGTGWKVDLIIRKPRPFSIEEFARRQPTNVEGTRLSVASVEDVIIAKLEWARLGESARQLEDVVALLRLRGKAIDQAYIDRWTKALGLGEQWTEVCRRAETPS